jgi:5-oxoprolinase (ATP-hydrolysing) subunit A
MFLNLDAGELPDETEQLWGLFDVVNVACGGHAGDAASMARVAAFCAASRVRFGAHPSYPDREGFGRRTLAIEPAALRDAVAAQCAALAEVAAAHELRVGTIKPHGALYHDAAAHEPIARAVLEGAASALGRGFVVIGPAAGALREAAAALDLGYAREGFADRRMRGDGTLVPRSEPDALITDPAAAAAQAAHLAASVDTLCVHADTPGALAIARAVREALGA